VIEFLTKYSITHLSLCCRNSSPHWNLFPSRIAGLGKVFDFAYGYQTFFSLKL